jgi:hypothetical protein
MDCHAFYPDCEPGAVGFQRATTMRTRGADTIFALENLTDDKADR